MIILCPKCKKELQFKQATNNIKMIGKLGSIFQEIDL